MTAPLPASVAAQCMEVWADDFNACAEDLYKVQTVDAEIIPFRQNDPQRCIGEIK